MSNQINIPNILPPTGEELKEAHVHFMNYLRSNPNNFSYWFPHVKDLKCEHINIPKSVIIPIPEDIYKAFYHEQEGDGEKIDRWVLENVVPVIEDNPWLNDHKVFVKNGCFSRKFHFSKGCLIDNPDDQETLITNISNIQADAVCLDTDGYLELVIREYIEPKPDTPTIYEGMPLRPEVRVFYDFDRHRYLYDVNYWDWGYCHDAICFDWDGTETPDAKTYEAAWPSLAENTKQLLEEHKPYIVKALNCITTLTMPEGNPNIWSVDFMLEEDRAWLIDMAQGWRSAYWDRRKVNE